MNENLNLVEILEGCPKGTKFYSSVFGVVELVEIKKGYLQPIGLRCLDGDWVYIGVDGRLFPSYDGECTLFPTKDQRNWAKFERFWDKPKVEKFDVNTLHPFDKILVRDSDKQSWTCEFFSHINNICNYSIIGLGLSYKWCIPYNEETKHLVGTPNDCPDYYKWWEK